MILSTIDLAQLRSDYLPQPKANAMFRSQAAPQACCDDASLKSWLRGAVGQVALTLDLNLSNDPHTIYTHAVDSYWDNDKVSWFLKRAAPVRPLLTVTEVSRYLGETKLQTIPSSWKVITNHVGGTVQLVPNPGKSTGLSQTSTLAYFPLGARGRYLPHEYHYKYTAGFVYPVAGTFTTTRNSTLATFVPDDPEQDAATAITSFAFSKLYVRNDVWVSVGGNVYLVTGFTGSQVRLGTPAVANYTGTEVLVLAYPEPIRRAVMAYAAIRAIEKMAAGVVGGVASTSLSLDALAQGRSYSVGKGFGIYSNLVQMHVDGLRDNLAEAWNAYGPVHGGGA